MTRHPGVPFVLFAFAVLSAVVVAAVSSGASADYVVLKNGRTLQGEISDTDDDVVRIKVSGGTITLPRSHVESIHRGEDAPPTADRTEDDRKRIAHQGGAPEKRSEYRYLDGTDPETGEVVLTKFTVLKPAGELAHGTLIEVLELKNINGLEMAHVRAGKLSGWIPADRLRASVTAEPVLRR